MKVEYYVDPGAEPWLVRDEPGMNEMARGTDLHFDNYEGEGYELHLRFARKGRSNRFYLVGIVRSSWDNADLEAVARST
jgi:hypothetical protein